MKSEQNSYSETRGRSLRFDKRRNIYCENAGVPWQMREKNRTARSAQQVLADEQLQMIYTRAAI